jgi:hypothetical protein
MTQSIQDGIYSTFLEAVKHRSGATASRASELEVEQSSRTGAIIPQRPAQTYSKLTQILVRCMCDRSKRLRGANYTLKAVDGPRTPQFLSWARAPQRSGIHTNLEANMLNQCWTLASGIAQAKACFGASLQGLVCMCILHSHKSASRARRLYKKSYSSAVSVYPVLGPVPACQGSPVT